MTTNRPVLGVVAPAFAQTVETALRAEGADRLADQVSDLRIRVHCDCAPLCSAFLSVPLDERGDGTLTTSLLLHTDEMTVLVETVGDLIVGLDVLDAGQLRTAVDTFAASSS